MKLHSIHILLLLLCLALAGCSTPGPVSSQGKKQEQSSRNVVPQDIQSLLAEADLATPARATELRLLAAQTSLASQNFDQLHSILDLITEIPPGDSGQELLFLKAELALARVEIEQALKWLSHPRMLSQPTTDTSHSRRRNAGKGLPCGSKLSC